MITMPTFYNDVDGKLEAVLENLLTTQAATTGSNIANVTLHTGLSTADVTEDLIFALVESAEESPSGTGNCCVQRRSRSTRRQKPTRWQRIVVELLRCGICS